ncbi:hypothetical protein GWK47_022849 [Chionoecetes opilio]|uniref:Uncharacterized protein n=1 Tax=Chionoecetes opilio TaxID=41210 RepID=A0A8J5CDI2_CHIOP|nr:hypothetical protein GWK47_022849 [Chionoecetes opilio]
MKMRWTAEAPANCWPSSGNWRRRQRTLRKVVAHQSSLLHPQRERRSTTLTRNILTRSLRMTMRKTARRIVRKTVRKRKSQRSKMKSWIWLNPHRVLRRQLPCVPSLRSGSLRWSATMNTTKVLRGMRTRTSVCPPLTPPGTSVPCLRTRPRRHPCRSTIVPRSRSTDLWTGMGQNFRF